MYVTPPPKSNWMKLDKWITHSLWVQHFQQPQLKYIYTLFKCTKIPTPFLPHRSDIDINWLKSGLCHLSTERTHFHTNKQTKKKKTLILSSKHKPHRLSDTQTHASLCQACTAAAFAFYISSGPFLAFSLAFAMQDPLDRNHVNDLARQETAFLQAERAFSVPLRLSAPLSKKKGCESLKLSVSTLTTQPKSIKNVPLYLFWPFAL